MYGAKIAQSYSKKATGLFSLRFIRFKHVFRRLETFYLFITSLRYIVDKYSSYTEKFSTRKLIKRDEGYKLQ